MFSLVDAFVEHKSIHLTQVKQFCKQLYHCNKSQDETEESACVSVQIRGVDPVSYLHELIVHYIAATYETWLTNTSCVHLHVFQPPAPSLPLVLQGYEISCSYTYKVICV